MRTYELHLYPRYRDASPCCQLDSAQHEVPVSCHMLQVEMGTWLPCCSQTTHLDVYELLLRRVSNDCLKISYLNRKKCSCCWRAMLALVSLFAACIHHRRRRVFITITHWILDFHVLEEFGLTEIDAVHTCKLRCKYVLIKFSSGSFIIS